MRNKFRPYQKVINKYSSTFQILLCSIINIVNAIILFMYGYYVFSALTLALSILMIIYCRHAIWMLIHAKKLEKAKFI